jgi:hypothetical protein
LFIAKGVLMVRSLWKAMTGWVNEKTEAKSDTPLHILARQARCANDLRELLRVEAKSPNFVRQQLPHLIEQIRAAAWLPQEVEKVLAYVDFFSGAYERGYGRVIQHGLAASDYTMFMTSCSFCYLADRFTEGAKLLEVFQPHEDPSTDWSEYLAFAGYISCVAGQPLADTLAYFDQALEGGYFSPSLAINAHPIYFEAGRLEHCRLIRELVQRNCPDDPEAVYALACAELARSYYPEGFRLMEARYRMPALGRTLKVSLLRKPRWTHESLAGKRILVHGEQGLGDLIMMARYLPLLRELGADLMMDGRTEGASLLTHNFPYCKFIGGDVQDPIAEPFDYWTGSMSLPHHFKTTAFNVPSVYGYFTVPPDQEAYWRPRVRSLAKDASLRVGLTWSGNPGHRADRRRSMSFDLMRSLVRRHPSIRFYSLQTHIPASHPGNMVDIADELLTMADTAAVIAEMDLVISVDTSAIHLAGALGHPAWLLLPYRYEWRWGLEAETNPWYSSVRVWRQRQPGAWAELLDAVSQALQEFKSTKAGR